MTDLKQSLAPAASAAFLFANPIGPRMVLAAEGGAGAAGVQPAAGGSPAGGDGATPPGAWYDTAPGFSDEQRTFLAGKGFTDLAAAVNAHMQADRMVRERNILAKPDPTRMAEWEGWAELGWKADRNDYSLKKPRVPDSFLYDAGFEKALVDAAHTARVPLPAAQAMLDAVVGYAAHAIDAVDANGAKANADLAAALKKDWGADYARNTDLAQRAARHLGIGLDDGAELEAMIGAPRMMQLFHKLGEMLGEDRLVSTAGGGSAAMSASQVQAELDRQAADSDFMKAFGDPRHPRYAEVRAQREALLMRKAKMAG
ncbi:hypothetical protein [Chelatococcus asaccharovorans]|uniref:Uncharacterized protein n=1 Tax=Chelatococcus asaccharovorans TaxID=28210 RepID=A0A2V3UAR0_9HYPH|nr:hypothetical protein [Chelatococcus asaccharovorans]MBS7703180.1 hypothetical protein [Chelatococcus asaccharovorans]PXW61509.1 hypothetical protein C7450_10324 [Chelatococcus asaccharovorans]